MPNSTPAPQPTPRPVFTAIMDLHKALRDAYGVDYAYTIMGHGRIIAASNLRQGNMPPIPDDV